MKPLVIESPLETIIPRLRELDDLAREQGHMFLAGMIARALEEAQLEFEKENSTGVAVVGTQQ